MVPRGSSWYACFHACPEDWLINRPQNVQVRSGESSIKRTLLQSPFSSVPALHFRAPRLPTWVSALSLTSLHRYRFARRPPLRWRCPGVLNRSTAMQCSLRACFIPQPSPGLFSRSGACPLRAAFSLHQAGYTHAVEHPHADLQAGCHARAPRLRRFAPHESR